MNRQELSDCVQCPRCKGSGELLLTDHSQVLAETLRLVRRQGEVTADEVAAALDPNGTRGVTAFCNRLEALREFGFVDRVKRGRAWHYYEVQP